MPALNFTMLQDEIRKGQKQQTIRLHRCKDCNMIAEPGAHFLNRGNWIGSPVKLYTGMRRKGQKAELLGVGIVTSVKLVQFFDLTEEIAEKDGFKRGYQGEVCQKIGCGLAGRRGECLSEFEERCTPLNKLHQFLRKNYKDAEQRFFEVISWELKEGGGNV